MSSGGGRGYASDVKFAMMSLAFAPYGLERGNNMEEEEDRGLNGDRGGLPPSEAGSAVQLFGSG